MNNLNYRPPGVVQPWEYKLVDPTKYSGRDEEDLHEWIKQFNHCANTNNWTDARKLQIVRGYLQGMAAIWYDQFKQWFGGWNGVNGFEPYFLAQFASPTMRKTWYTEYKNMKQNGRTVDEYTTEFLIK